MFCSHSKLPAHILSKTGICSVTLEETTERRSNVFYMFDQNEDDLFSAEVAASDESPLLALMETVVLVPMIPAYTAYTYRSFLRKIDPEDGYP